MKVTLGQTIHLRIRADMVAMIYNIYRHIRRSEQLGIIGPPMTIFQ
jgi:hypothetical protein